MKRLLSILLVIVMVLAPLCTVSAFADAVELTDNSTYNGIRKKSDGSILFSPMMGLLRTDVNAALYAYDSLTFEMVFTQLTGSGGSEVYTFPKAVATTKKGNGSYFDIYLKNGTLNSGFCPTEGCYYNIYVEVYASGTEIYYGTYTNVKAAGISGSAYYDPTRIPTDAAEITETAFDFTGTALFNGGFTLVDDTICFSPYATELRTAVDGGAALSDYEITMKISKLRNGSVSYTWKQPIITSILDGGSYFLIPLCGENDTLFCPTAGSSYQIDVEILQGGSKVFYGTYTNVTCGDDVISCNYYNPTTIATPIKEADPSYTGQRYYKTGAYQYGFRVSSKGYILFSPLVADLRDDINAGATYADFTAYETISVKETEGGEVLHTYEPISAAFGSSSGTYFDVTLQSNSVDSGFCPTVGYYYDIYCEIYKNGELLYYGTYSDLYAVPEIGTSSYYRPSSIPGVMDYDVDLTYDFTNTVPGSAAGKIVMTVSDPGYFELYWGDANEQALNLTLGDACIPYSPVATFAVPVNGTEDEYVYSVLPYAVIPNGAKYLLVCDSEGGVIESLEIPTAKLLAEETPNFSFGLLSDIHYNQFRYDGATDDASVAFPRALAFYKAAGVNLVTGAGDYGVYQEVESYQAMNAAVTAAEITFLGCGGNHEVYSGSDRMYLPNGPWRTYMNTGVYDETPMEGVLNVADNGIDFVYRIPGDETSVFVFLSQMYNDSKSTAQGHLLDTAQVVWLSEQLAAYADKQVYLYFHTYLFDEDGKTANGEGDITTGGGATYGGGYNQSASEYAVFKALLDQYTNVTWFNGHSHYEYAMQKFNSSMNITDNNGTTATMIHVPSCTCPRTATATSTSLGQLHGRASEGGLMLCYDDYDVMIGIDLMNGKAYSYASYIIYKDKTDVVETLTEDGITQTYDAQTATLTIEGEGEVTAAAFDGAKKLFVSNGITAIADGAFASFDELAEIRLPESLTTIGDSAFGASIAKVVYAGTSVGFEAITIGSGNTALIGAAKEFRKFHIIFNVEGETSSVDVNAWDVPTYDGLPVKPHDDPEKVYVFTGWKNGSVSIGKVLPGATADATYTAVFGAEAVRYIEGYVNTHITWKIDRLTGTLTLYGTGAMPDYAAELSAQPWAAYANDIITVHVDGRITKIGKNNFARLPVLTTIKLCEGTTTLNADAFSYCPMLTDLYLPKSITSVGQGTVYQDKVLTTIHFSGNRADWLRFCNSITTNYNTGITGCEDVRLYDAAEAVAIEGDVNADGIVNISDVSDLLNLIANGTEVFGNPDLNGDGFVNICDVSVLLTLVTA